MLKQNLTRLAKIEKHFASACVDEKAYAGFCAWCSAHPSNMPMNSDAFDFHAWCERVPTEHRRGLSHWFRVALEAVNDTSRELVCR